MLLNCIFYVLLNKFERMYACPVFIFYHIFFLEVNKRTTDSFILISELRQRMDPRIS